MKIQKLIPIICIIPTTVIWTVGCKKHEDDPVVPDEPFTKVYNLDDAGWKPERQHEVQPFTEPQALDEYFNQMSNSKEPFADDIAYARYPKSANLDYQSYTVEVKNIDKSKHYVNVSCTHTMAHVETPSQVFEYKGLEMYAYYGLDPISQTTGWQFLPKALWLGLYVGKDEEYEYLSNNLDWSARCVVQEFGELTLDHSNFSQYDS